MKRMMFAVIGFLSIASVVQADPLCVPTGNILDYNGSGGCESHGLHLSGFIFGTSGAGSIGPQAVLSIIEVGQDVTFNLDPNQGSTLAQTSTLAFNVVTLSGLPEILGASSANGGSLTSSLRQVICDGTINFATGACNGTLLQDVTNLGGTSTPTQLFVSGASDSFGVWRHLLTPEGAQVDAVSFDFRTTARAVPEPTSLLLLGTGLLLGGVSAWKRRRRLTAASGQATAPNTRP